MSDEIIRLLISSTWESCYMILASGVISTAGGFPLGVLLFITRADNIMPHHWLNQTLALSVNVIRAIPFIILLIALIPFTRLLIGTSIGTTAAIVPLSIAAIPFVARIVENALSEVNSGLIEAGHAMGATTWQLIHKILFPEALPGIVQGLTVTWIALVGYSAMAGTVGGGGLGSLAINYGYLRFNVPILIATVIILILIVYVIQYFGEWLTRRLEHG